GYAHDRILAEPMSMSGQHRGQFAGLRLQGRTLRDQHPGWHRHETIDLHGHLLADILAHVLAFRRSRTKRDTLGHHAELAPERRAQFPSPRGMALRGGEWEWEERLPLLQPCQTILFDRE